MLDFEKNPYSSSGPETTIPGNSLPDLTDASEVDDAKSKSHPSAWWWARRRRRVVRRRRYWKGGRRFFKRQLVRRRFFKRQLVRRRFLKGDTIQGITATERRLLV